MGDCPQYILILLPLYEKATDQLKQRNLTLWKILNRKIEYTLANPYSGKPLKNILRNYRRVHVKGSFVLLYEVRNCEVRLVDFDHHDRIYKKYS